MSNIRITELDFDTIKTNLKNYLRSQAEFTDYDFEGSGLSVLLDVLAYNTHYNAYMANMLANEMFLDSAVKRESATSIAKHLQYVPRSTIGALARLNVTYGSQPGNPSLMTIDRYSSFTTTIDGVNYSFVNLEPLTAQRLNGQYYFDEIEVKEGVSVTNSYTVQDGGPSEKFVLLSDNPDITTLRVVVQESSTNSQTTVYTKASDLSAVDITEIESTETIFFVEENSQGRYEIFFGDGKIGKRLVPGNIVFIYYLTSSGSKVNVSTTIGSTQIFTGPSINGVAPSVITVESPNGGQEKETIDEVKFNAPRANAAQNRLVTVDDYKALIKREVTNIKAMNVWGGEESIPPQYGKVFISILPTSGNAVTPQTKNKIVRDIVGSKRVVAITPEIIDPEFFYVNLDVLVKYKAASTVLTSDQIRQLVQSKIANYFNTNLDTFNESFIYSKLIKEIDAADQSIVGNQTIAKLQTRFTPSLIIGNNNRLLFNNVIAEGTIETTRFICEQAGTLVPARIRDIPDDSTVVESGTYRRSGSIITLKFTDEHGLTENEEVFLSFTGAAVSGKYKIYRVLSPFTFTVVSLQTGSASGTVQLTSNPRGTLQLYNPTNSQVIINKVGFVSYLEGIVQFNTLYVKGFPSGIRDIKLTVGLVEGSKDINVYRNQILRLDGSSSSTELNQLAGLTITVLPV